MCVRKDTYDKVAEAEKQAREIELKLIPLKAKVQKHLFNITAAIVSSELTKNKFVVNIDTNRNAEFQADIDATKEEYEFIHSLIDLRNEIKSPFTAPPEIMALGSHPLSKKLLDEFNRIIVSTSKLKGVLIVTENELLVNIPL